MHKNEEAPPHTRLRTRKLSGLHRNHRPILRSPELIDLEAFAEKTPELDEDLLENSPATHQHSGRIADILDFEDNDPLASMLRDESTRLIGHGLDRLSTMQRLCIVLSFYDNMPLSRIAEVLSLTEERVSSLRRRGLRKLGEYLRKFQ